MAKTRRQYAGGAVATTVASSISASGVSSFSIAANTGWPSTPSVPFYIVVSPQTSSEEKMLVTISGTTLTVVSRGVDGTTASSHSSGASVYPVITAVDLNEANELTAKYASRGSIVYQGATTFEELPKGSTGLVLKAGSNDPEWGQVGESAIATGAVTEDKIAGNAVTSGKIADGAIVNADINASAAIELSKLATGALPTDITVASANIVNGTIVNEDINASAAIALSKLATGALPTGITVASANVVNGSLLTTDFDTSTAVASGGVPVTTVSTSEPSGGKDGDIWVKVV